MERDFATQMDEWLRLTGGDTGSGGTIPTEYGGEPFGSAPTTANWTDPDTAMPDWLHDPNADMSARTLPPGLRWVFQDGMWRTYQDQRAPGPVVPPTTDPNPGGRRDPDPGDDPTFGPMAQPNAGFTWPTLNLPRASYPNFAGFKPFKQPTPDEILNDPVLQAQLKEGNNRIKQDRAFRGILNTGDTLKDIFDWTSDRIKLGGHDAFDRAFKVYDVNERQNPFNTWSANKDKYFQEFNTNLPSAQNEFLYNQYNPAKALWDQNYNMWSKQGDWLSDASRPIV